jgi:hypothetical protein
MPFDETRYVQDFIRKHRGAQTLPDDLLARYAITLPATDVQVAAQVRAVRTYWNSKYQGTSTSARLAKMCRAEDERLRAVHGAAMEQTAWWQARQSERRSAAQDSINRLAEVLRQKYGQLGVVTMSITDRYASKLDLTRADAVQAVQQAGLALVEAAAVPDSPPIAQFPTLVASMAECAARSVPELIHPGAGRFRLLERYVCASDPAKRLDVVAVDTQLAEAEKRGVSATDNARRAALRILRSAVKGGADLREIALYHLATIARDLVSLSAGVAAAELQDAGLDHGDSVVLALLIDDQQSVTAEQGADRVHTLLAAGRLNEARQAALAIPADSAHRAETIADVNAASERLDLLLAEAERAMAVADEVRAAALLREARAISVAAAGEALAAVPLAPPVNLRVVGEGATARLFWQPAPGHDEGTTYAVTRTEHRAPAAAADGAAVHRGAGLSCTDEHAPVARVIRYGVFALADGRPDSRPATAAITLLPPVSQLHADAAPSEVTLHWSAHPAVHQVRVTRTTPGMPLAPVPVTGSSGRLTGLAEGQAQHFEVTAVYTGPDGAEMCSLSEQISVTPRSEAQPVPRLRVRPVETAGSVRVRVAWAPVDKSEVRIHRSDTPPGWPMGARVTAEEMAGFGHQLTGRRIPGPGGVTLEAEVPPGVHHLVPFSIGGTGIVVGGATAIGITDPVSNLAVTPFASYATLSWEWPRTSQLAEVSWEVDGEADTKVIGLAEYRTLGGVQVPLGRGPCTVEVRAMIVANGIQFTSPPVGAVVDSVVDVAVRYTVSSTPALGPFGGRSKLVVFTSDEACEGVHVRLVAQPGRVMPTSADHGFVLLDTSLALQPGVPVPHRVTVPRAVRRPYWVRCFLVAGRARLIDPPVQSLKEG